MDKEKNVVEIKLTGDFKQTGKEVKRETPLDIKIALFGISCLLTAIALQLYQILKFLEKVVYTFN